MIQPQFKLDDNCRWVLNEFIAQCCFLKLLAKDVANKKRVERADMLLLKRESVTLIDKLDSIIDNIYPDKEEESDGRTEKDCIETLSVLRWRGGND